MTTTSPLSLTPRTEPDLLDALGHPIPAEEDALDEPCEAPDDADHADRMLYSLGRLKDRLAEIERIANAQVERVALWQQTESEKIKRRYDWLEQGVTGWARAAHEADPSKKTISLPNGEVKIRPRQPRLETHAPLLDLNLLRQTRPEWVREKIEVDKSAIKRAVVASGCEAEIGPDAPEGYVAHHAVDPDTSEIVPGLFLFLPASKQITVTPA